MPDRRRHRSAAPGDREQLGPGALPALRAAVEDLSWLLGRGYGDRAGLVLVGDRHGLTARQREFVARCACSDELRDDLAMRRLGCEDLHGRHLVIDGFNVLVTLEAALGGAAVLLARDGCARDLLGVRGTWRRIAETTVAVELVGALLAEAGAGPCTWVLDRGVSNAGRLKALLLAAATEHGWSWSVEVVERADARLVAARAVVASADREILSRCGEWTALAREAVEARLPEAWVVDLSAPQDAVD